MCALKSAFKTKGKLSLLTALPALSNFLWILTDYSMILLISGINYPELSQTPRLWAQFYKTAPPLQMPITSCEFQGYTHFCLTWLQPPPQVW